VVKRTGCPEDLAAAVERTGTRVTDVMRVMLRMKKIDIVSLQRAAG
jgi:hypothetical protein